MDLIFEIAYQQLLEYVKQHIPYEEYNYFQEWKPMLKNVFELAVQYQHENGKDCSKVAGDIIPLLAELAYVHLSEDNAFEIMVRMSHATIAFSFFLTWIIVVTSSDE